MLRLNINSETSKLEAVLLHEPGPEVENMTPATAERALYSDILNLSIASEEYKQLKEVLGKVARIYELKDLLIKILKNNTARSRIINDFSIFNSSISLNEQLKDIPAQELARIMIEGIPFSELSLSNYLNKEQYIVSPLHNALYTRDTSFVIGNKTFIGKMAKVVRIPEAIVMKNIFEFSEEFETEVIDLNNLTSFQDKGVTVEGGDILVLSSEVIIVGIGSRTTARGIDELIKLLSRYCSLKYVLIQELPDQPESFIHLDMVFTVLCDHECLIYEPLILESTRYHTVLMTIENNKICKIESIDNLIKGLLQIGIDMKPVICGGSDKRSQEREQWHSGANVFAFDQGKIIGYRRNGHTAEELSKQGYTILTASEFIKRDLTSIPEKIMVTVDGSELSRGGGGVRCMTLPLRRV